MLSDKLQECLMCPVCGGAPLNLVVEEADGDVIADGNLGCPDCKRWYVIRDDIPHMMPPDLGSNLVAGNQRWEPWQAAMERFLHWRDEAWQDPTEAAERRESARAMHRRFIEFCALPEGPLDVLDVGCGTGHAVDLLPESARYVGLDPLLAGRAPGRDLPAEMPRPQRPVALVQGVGESLPFTPGSFDLVLLMGTLDHARSPEEMLTQAAHVLRPGATLGVLQGVAAKRQEGGFGGMLRSLVGSLSGEQGPSARETHLHTFASADELAALIAEHLDVSEATEDANRAFVRATARADTSEGDA